MSLADRAMREHQRGDEQLRRLRTRISAAIDDAWEATRTPVHRPAAYFALQLELFKARKDAQEARRHYRIAATTYSDAAQPGDLSSGLSEQMIHRAEAMAEYENALKAAQSHRVPHLSSLRRQLNERLPLIGHKIEQTRIGRMTKAASIEALATIVPADPEVWRPEITDDKTEFQQYRSNVAELVAQEQHAINNGEVALRSPKSAPPGTWAHDKHLSGCLLRREVLQRMSPEQRNLHRVWRTQTQHQAKTLSTEQYRAVLSPMVDQAQRISLAEKKPFPAARITDEWAETTHGVPAMPYTATAPISVATSGPALGYTDQDYLIAGQRKTLKNLRDATSGQGATLGADLGTTAGVGTPGLTESAVQPDLDR